MLLVGKGVTIRQAGSFQVGRNFVAQDHCEINCLSQNGIIFGDKVTVGSYAMIRPTNLYGGELGEGLKVGNNSSIGPYAYIGCSGYIEIGNNVMMSPRVSIYAENHVFANPAAGSIVTKDVPPNSVVGGNPAKLIKSR